MESANGESLSEVLQAEAHVWNYCLKFMTSLSLNCAVQLGIPDVIHNHGRPMTLPELVNALPIQAAKAQHLYRLMRLLVSSGFFVLEKVGPNDEEEGYSLTPASQLLLKDNPFTVRPFFLAMLDPILIKPWEYMRLWFENNDPMPFVTAHNMLLWEYAGKDERFNSSFNEAMTADCSLVSSVLLNKGKDLFQGVTSLVDVGGGRGAMAKAIAGAFPQIECICFDLPHVVSELKDSGNLKYRGGDMFVTVPPADAVLLKWILHSLNDEDCVRILKQCKAAIASAGEKGKLIIIDMVLGNQHLNVEGTETQLLFDLLMMANVAGRERSEREWAKLFMEAGFSSYKIHPIFHVRAIIEAYP